MASREDVIAELTAPGGDFALHEVTAGGVRVRAYEKAPPSLRELFLATRQFGDRDFLIFGDEVLTYAAFHEQVQSLAAHLHDIGVRKGDRVAIGMRNYPEWVVSFWACQVIGAVAVALNAWWTAPELAYALEDSGSRVVIVDQERLERLRDIDPAPALDAIILVRGEGHPAGTTSYADIVAERWPLVDASPGPEDFATILYTSGTTGRSKGAAATHRNHITNITNTLLSGATARRMAGITEAPTAQTGALQTFPFFHIGGLSGLYLSTVTGAKIALMYRWSPAEAVELIERHALTSVAGVPYVVRQLLESAREAGKSLASLQGVASGGAAVPPDLVRTIGSQFQTKVAPANGYGLTETTSAVIAAGGLDYLENPDSVGKPVVTADVRVVDDNGRDCAEGEIGEIWIRGSNVIPGYWRNPEATAEAFTDGWFHSGDLGYRDAKGYHYIVDRKKDVIIRGGENVYCVEVEAALLEHPMVRDVAVLALPHPELGEIVACVVQPRSSMAAGALEEELNTYLQDRLARFKIPTRYAVTGDDLPRTATGKLLKRDMRGRYFQVG